MNASFYIVIQGKEPSYGVDRKTRRDPGTIRATKTRPSTKKDEIAIRMEMDIPDSLYVKPTLSAKVSVPEPSATSHIIDTEVATNIESVIREQMGINLQVSADLPESQEDVER